MERDTAFGRYLAVSKKYGFMKSRSNRKNYYCSLCLNKSCDCGKEKIRHKEAQAQMVWWLEILDKESEKQLLVANYPKWPVEADKLNTEVEYKVTLQLKLPILLVTPEGVYNENRKRENINLTSKIGFYGYWFDSNFWPLVGFNKGWVHKLNGFPKLPSAEIGQGVDVSGFEDIISGYWYIPQVKNYDLFCRSLFRW